MNQNKDVMVANAIIEAIGGKENIRAVGHCSSRLRLTLNDKKVVNEAEIENIDGVKGQFFAGNTRLFLERDLLIVCMLLWLEIRVLS